MPESKNEEQGGFKNFLDRRKVFDEYIHRMDIKVFTCPCCGYPTLKRRGLLDFCNVCFWEDDGQDDSDAEQVKGGPNGDLSLKEGRLKMDAALRRIVEDKKGVLNEDFNEVMQGISRRDQILREFIKEKTNKNTSPDNSIWEEYRELKRSSLDLLLKKKNL